MIEENDELIFDKEVDFHHQIAYRFEKAARFKANKKPAAIINAANSEIIKLIDSGSWIIDIDPMIIFYSIYFSVFYQNTELFTYLDSYVKRRGLTRKDSMSKSTKKKAQSDRGIDLSSDELKSNKND